MRIGALFICSTLAALLAATSAPAGEQPSEARQHFDKGQTHYALGEFENAVTEFREAFRLRNEPAILFNIAQAMRQLGHYKQAYFYYSQYLSRKPEAQNRAEVEQFMLAMHKKVEADEEAERARADADGARPPSARFPEDHLEEADEKVLLARAAPGKPEQVKPAAATLKPPASGKGQAANKVEGAGRSSGIEGARLAAAVTRSATGASTGASAGASTGASTGPAVAAPTAASREAKGDHGEAGESIGSAPSEALAAPAMPASTGTSPLRYAGIAALGVGVAAEGLAYVFHGSAQAAADELNQKYRAGTLQPSDAHLKDDVSSKGGLATMAAIGGGVLLITGALLTFAF